MLFPVQKLQMGGENKMKISRKSFLVFGFVYLFELLLGLVAIYRRDFTSLAIVFVFVMIFWFINEFALRVLLMPLERLLNKLDNLSPHYGFIEDIKNIIKRRNK